MQRPSGLLLAEHGLELAAQIIVHLLLQVVLGTARPFVEAGNAGDIL